MTIQPRPTLLVLLMALCVATTLEAARYQTGRLAGKVSKDIYTAPKGLFTLKIPVMPEMGGRVEDDVRGLFAVTDDIGHYYRIEYIPLTPEMAQQRTTLGEQLFLRRLLIDFYLPNTVWKFAPGAPVLDEEFTAETSRLAVWMSVPKGSVYTTSTSDIPTPHREDSYRRISVFTHKNYLLFVSVVPSGPQVTGFGKPNPEPQVRAQVAKASSDFIASITWRD